MDSLKTVVICIKTADSILRSCQHTKETPEEQMRITRMAQNVIDSLQPVKSLLENERSCEANSAHDCLQSRERFDTDGSNAIEEPAKPIELEKPVAKLEMNLKALEENTHSVGNTQRPEVRGKRVDILENIAKDLDGIVHICKSSDDVPKGARCEQIVNVDGAKGENLEAIQFSNFMQGEDNDNHVNSESAVLQWLEHHSYHIKDPLTDIEVFPWVQWFLDSDEYRLWLERQSWILWCYGAPLVGKTILCLQVIQDLHRVYPERSVVLKLLIDSSTKSPTTADLICSLVVQLLQKTGHGESELLEQIYRDYKHHNTGPGLNEMLQLLAKGLDSDVVDQVFVIVDGWSSLPQDTALGLDRILKELIQKHKGVRVMVSSCTASAESFDSIATCCACYTSNLNIYFYCKDCADQVYCWTCHEEGGYCKKSGHDMSEPCSVAMVIQPECSDIEAYVNWRIDQLVNGAYADSPLLNCSADTINPRSALCDTLERNPELRETVSSGIAILSMKSFQAANLYCNDILFLSNFEEICDAIDRCREKMALLFQRKIDEIVRDSPRSISQTIQDAIFWISSAKRLLPFPELCQALSMQLTDETYCVDGRVTEADLYVNSRGLIQMEPEYVTIDPDMIQWLQEQTKSIFVGKDIELAMKLLACLNYGDLQAPCKDDSEAEVLARLETSPLLRYACQFWAEHVVPVLSDDKVYQQLLRFLRNPDKVSIWAHIHYRCGMPREDEVDVRKGINGLHLAAYHGVDRIIADLIADGFDIDSADYGYQQTALMYACRRGHTSTVKLLLENGANAHLKSLRGSCALFEAYLGPDTSPEARQEIVKLLLDQPDSDVNVHNGQRENLTLLMFATASGDDATAKMLINRPNIKINSRDMEGRTALVHAVRHSHGSTVDLLLKDLRTRKDLRTHNLDTALSEAANVDNLHIAESLLAGILPTEDIHFAFCNAIKSINPGFVQLLIKKKVAMDVIDETDGLTYLHKAVLSKSAKMVQLLILEGKMDVDCRDKRRSTPLHYAARLGHMATVMVLLDAGADRNAKDGTQRTPLIVARQNAETQSHFRVMNLLDVGPNGENFQREQIMSNLETLPTWSVVRHGKLVGLDELERRVGDPRKWDLADCDPDTGNTGLHLAVLASYKKKEDALKLLLGAHVSQALINHAGETALYLAAELGYFRITTALLASFPAPLNVPANNGVTPLTCALRAGNLCVAVKLISAGADISDEDRPYLQDTFVRAIHQQEATAVTRLLNIGADAMWTGSKGDKSKALPLQIAQMYENYDGGSEVIRILERQKTRFDGFMPLDSSDEEDSDND